jgi:hypothetical protein
MSLANPRSAFECVLFPKISIPHLSPRCNRMDRVCLVYLVAFESLFLCTVGSNVSTC